MDLKYILGLFMSAVGTFLTIEGLNYKRRRDQRNDMEAIRVEADSKIEKTKIELNNRMTQILTIEREKFHSEIARLDDKIDRTSSLIEGHIDYSRKNHPTNETVFPFLERLEGKLDALKDHQLEEKEKEIQRLQNLLEKERG